MSEPTVRPVHDRPTLISFTSLAAWSWLVYGFGASLALLRDDQGVSVTVAGLHSSALAIGGVIGALVTPHLSHRYGRGLVGRIGAIGCALSMVWFLWPGTPVGSTLAAVFVATFFGNIIVVSVNSFIASHQGAASPAAFTESLGLAALMGLLAPLGVGFAAGTVFGWRAGMAVGVIAFIVIELLRGRLSAYGGAGEVRLRKEGGALPPLTWWALVAGMCYIGAEFSMSLWTADLLRVQAGMDPASAAKGLAAILGGVFVGRVFGIRLAERFPTERLLRISLSLGLVMFAIVWLVSTPVVMLIALFLMGVALSLTWPLSVSRILRASQGNPDRASALSLAFTTTAIGVAPFVLGAFAASVGVHLAFLIVPTLIVITLILVIIRPVADPR